MKFSVIIAAALASWAAVGQGPLSGVSIPPGSQDAGCFPVWHNVYSVTAPPYPLSTTSGVGYLVNGSAVSAYADFALHDHVYVAPQIPNPARAVVDYTFRWPTAVYGVEIIQHTNGVTKLEGFGGDSPTTLVSAGQSFGPAGDIAGFNVIPEFQSQVFPLPTPVCGTLFRLIVRKTSHVDGWATYRMFPLDAAGNRIAVASAPNAFAANVVGASSAGGLTVQLQINAGPAHAGSAYVVVGSVSGACPGIAVSGVGTLPVVYDLFAAYTLFGPLAPQTSAYQGALDASGIGTALVAVAPGAYPQLVGTTFTHAAGVVGAGGAFFTNPASFTVLP